MFFQYADVYFQSMQQKTKNIDHGRFPKQRTPINSRFSEKFRKQTCFSKLFTGNNSQPEKYILLLKITNCLNHCPQTA